MTATQIINKLALKYCGVFSAYIHVLKIETPKKQANQSRSHLQINAKFASVHLQLNLEQANWDEFQQKNLKPV